MNVRTQFISFALFVTLYLASYAMLSIGGKYEDNYSTLGRLGTHCLCISDENQWQPSWLILVRTTDGGVQTYYANAMAYAFLPLLKLDQAHWHPTSKIVR